MIRRPTLFWTSIDILIIIGLIIWAYGLYSFFISELPLSHWTIKPAAKTPLSYEENEEKKQAQAVIDSQIYNAAIDARDTSTCEKISDQGERSRCLDAVGASLALLEQDEKKCDSLSSWEMIERCRDNVIFSRAEANNDTTMCEKISDENLRLQCREILEQAQFQNAMNSWVILDTAFCRTFSGSVREKCEARIVYVTDAELYQKALVSKLISDCDRIGDSKMVVRCKDTLSFEMAMRDGEIDLCEALIDEEKKVYCRETITAQRDATLYKSITAWGQVDQCESIQSVTLREQCHDIIIMREVRVNQDIAACDSLYNTGMIFWCKSIKVKEIE